MAMSRVWGSAGPDPLHGVASEHLTNTLLKWNCPPCKCPSACVVMAAAFDARGASMPTILNPTALTARPSTVPTILKHEHHTCLVMLLKPGAMGCMLYTCLWLPCRGRSGAGVLFAAAPARRSRMCASGGVVRGG